MFSIKSKQRKHCDRVARELYAIMVEQSRLPVFYTDYGVPDTVEGRFDLLALHVGLLLRRLGSGDLAQALVDVMFADMDVNLRETGVSDIMIGRRVRKLAEAFYGRLDVYARAVDSDDRAAMADALLRNLFRRDAHPRAADVAAYAFGLAERLAATGDQTLSGGCLELGRP